jgi:FMN phosphatase YigB (HAD superfamily)
MSPTVASFDVFDTCLTREVGRPPSAFLLLGRLLQRRGRLDLGPVPFAHARRTAEANARRNAGRAEFTLADVAGELSAVFGLGADGVEWLIGSECDVEARLLRPVPSAARRVRSAREAGRTIAFLSDMYLPSSFIEEQLRRHGLLADGDVLMVSCETNTPKWTGDAFHQLARQQSVELGDIEHLGDDPRIDVIVPRRLGVRAAPFDDCRLNRYETLLERAAGVTGGLSSVMAGASRRTRLELDVAGGHHVAIRDVAAGVVAPAFVGFTLWVLRRAQQLGLRRLYFVARDGQILIDVAQRIAARSGVDVELVYVHGSRLAWWLPGVSSVAPDEIEWAFATSTRLDVRTVTTRLGLTLDQAEPLLAAAGLQGRPERELLTDEELARLRSAVDDPGVATLLLEAAEAARRPMVAYARQMGMLDGTPSALVDIGWIGRLHVSLGKVLRAAGGDAPVGLFYGISGGPPNGDEGVREAYAFDARTPTGFCHDVDGVVNMFDVFCTGFGGQTKQYEFDDDGDGSARPVFGPDHDAVKERWGLRTLQAAVHHFADVLVLDDDLVDTEADVRAVVDELVDAFLHDPTVEEARAWGSFPREDEAGEHERRLAVPYTAGYVLARLRNDTIARDFRYWKEGSIAISPWPLRQLVAGAPRAARVAARGRGVVRRSQQAIRRIGQRDSH